MKLITAILFIFISCYSNTIPGWITSQQKAEDYWFGIGIVEKSHFDTNIREIARNEAVNEIASQIKINLSSSFERVISENNLSLDEVSNSILQTRLDNNLSNIIIVDSYEDKNRYYLLVKLSKSLYYETIEQQRRNSIEAAMKFISQAELELSSYSLSCLSNAMDEIISYIDFPIERELPTGSGKIVNIYSYIKILTSNYLNRIKIIPNEKKIIVNKIFNDGIKLKVKVVDRNTGAPLQNIPIICTIIDNENKVSALSDSIGNCIFAVPRILHTSSIQYINYKLDVNALIENTNLFDLKTKINSQSIIEVSPLKIFIDINENNLGVSVNTPYVEPLIVEYFADYFSANFVDYDESSDLIIAGLLNTRFISEQPNEYGIFQVFGDANIFVKNTKTGDKILEKSYKKIQGSDFNSNEEAGNQALKKISNKIIEDFLPKVSNLIEN